MATYHIDQIDQKILSFLVKNARMPFLEIARECGVSGAAIHQRVKRLEAGGVITGSRLLVKPQALGLNVCAGSLSAGAYNNVVELAKKFASRTHFVHLRSCHIFPNGDFTEASHLGGRADLIELCRIFEKENPELPMRVDHGMTFTDEPGGIMDESSHGHNAGYTLLGRMFALGQVQGILATVDRELGIEYKQPGFFD